MSLINSGPGSANPSEPEVPAAPSTAGFWLYLLVIGLQAFFFGGHS